VDEPLLQLRDRPLLIYGIGNVGRQDDGLGPLLLERLSSLGVPEGVTLESGYQLAPEDALLLSTHACVVFVDATVAVDAAGPYSLESLVPAAELSFTSHAMGPGALLTLCRRLYGVVPRAFVLSIPGYAFEVNANLSPAAATNLDAALRDLRVALAAGA
jgi:hydrogenase maturation protease